MAQQASNYRVQLAFETSIRDFKANLKDDDLYKELFQTTTIDEVYDLTDKLQEEQMKTGNLRHLAKLGPFLERLRGYAGAIDTFIQVKPDILALIWGPIKLLIQWTSTLKKSLDQLIKTIGDIGDVLPEFEEIMKIFGHNEQINDVLALFFQDILDIYVIALKFFSSSRWSIVFEAVWPRKRENIQIILSRIERHTFLMRNETRMEHIREEHEARLIALDDYAKSERRAREQEYRATRQDISPKMYEEELSGIRHRICAGTGKWLLRDSTFSKWLKTTDPATKFIWLQGIPGAGKTYLSATTVDEILALAPDRTLYAFLSYKHRSSITAIAVLHSLIFQLTDEKNREDLQALLLSEYSAKELKRDPEKTVKLLTTFFGMVGQVFIIIDGLDEVEEHQREILLRYLLELSNSCEETKFLVSSRIEDDIHTILRDRAIAIRIDTQNSGSIQAFVNHRTEELLRGGEFEPVLEAEIRRLLAPLSSKAKGMFLYAKIVLSSVEHLDDMTEIRNELQYLPESLDHAYARILERINLHENRTLKEKARKLLGWVGSSLTPLTVQEIEQALTVNPDDPNGNSILEARRVLSPVRICGPILEVVDDYVQLVHFTAKEYFFSPNITNHIDCAEANLSLAACCIEYLCQNHHDTGLSEEEFHENTINGKYRLHEYSVSMWLDLLFQYARMTQSETPPKDLIYLLEKFIEQRSSNNFNEDSLAPMIQPHLQSWFKNKHPAIYTILQNYTSFHKKCSEGEFDKRKEVLWISRDPLTLTTISIRLSGVLELLLCGSQDHHNVNCHCGPLTRHYGKRPFKCSFLGCSFTRHGFSSKSARNSHQKQHGRPWKCSRSDCQYSQGFLSRTMRDKHWAQCHREPQDTKKLPPNLDKDEIQPLFFDLVRADKVALVKPLLGQVYFERSVKIELLSLAASSASPAMVDLLKVFQPNHDVEMDNYVLSIAALKGNNIDTFKHLLQDIRCYHLVLNTILESGANEFLADWELHIHASCRFNCPFSSPRLWRGKGGACARYTNSSLIATTRNNPGNEALILSIWKIFDLPKLSTKEYLGSTLGTVAEKSFSIQLAKYLINGGAPIDYRRSNTYMTPLHYAATHDTLEAAELVEFLLGSGADSEAFSQFSRYTVSKIRRIRDEKGAKGISKWLGLSWDELVEKKKKKGIAEASVDEKGDPRHVTEVIRDV